MKPRALIVDRDGTLASVSYISPKDRKSESWRQFNAALIFDAPVPDIVRTVRLAHELGFVVIVVSGRMMGDSPYDFRRRYLMEQWLNKHEIPYDFLFMRRGGDNRMDCHVKIEIYQQKIQQFFEVTWVIDDRPQVIDAWKELGLNVWKVTDPDIFPMIARNDER